MRILVKVIPKSRRQEAVYDKNVIKVWLHAAPDKGKANEELVLILADKLNLPKSAVKIHAGFSSSKKIVDILGLTREDLDRIFRKDGTEAGA